jgi:methylated-DNA-[protein]-cysteine S-methyltransferase
LEDAARWGAVVLPPIRWRNGRMAFRLVAPHDAPPPWWSAQHDGARLVQKHRTEPRELMELLDRPAGSAPPLTHRQSEVLLEAVRLGYYSVPRRSTVRDVARRLHIARSTAEEHLRAAESAMIRSTAPLVAARQRAETLTEPPADASSFELYAQYCAELELYVQMAMRDEKITRVTFGRTRPRGIRKGAHPYLQRILDHVATGTDGLEDLPIELDVGPFTRRVLEEVRRIPPGATRTYGEIAQRLGEPRAARAVGNALAENPALVVVPCHRVVPSRGGVGQYSGAGGHQTKLRLLRKEGAIDAGLDT